MLTSVGGLCLGALTLGAVRLGRRPTSVALPHRDGGDLPLAVEARRHDEALTLHSFPPAARSRCVGCMIQWLELVGIVTSATACARFRPAARRRTAPGRRWFPRGACHPSRRCRDGWRAAPAARMRIDLHADRSRPRPGGSRPRDHVPSAKRGREVRLVERQQHPRRGELPAIPGPSPSPTCCRSLAGMFQGPDGFPRSARPLRSRRATCPPSRPGSCASRGPACPTVTTPASPRSAR